MQSEEKRSMAIWSKGGDETNALVHAFTVGQDATYDGIIAPYDLLGCIAHACWGRVD